MADKIIGQLNATYDDSTPPDMSLITLADIDGVATTSNAVSANIAHANGGRIASGDGTTSDRGFLKHTFQGWHDG